MQDSPKVVYAAKNVQQAYLLKNVLEEAGIRAVVSNATLESGSGVDYVGWYTLARVVVDEPDFDTAREIALDYDRAGAAIAQQQTHEELARKEGERGPILHEWPQCPKCNAKRITQCPVCQTTGSEFPEADSEFVWGMGLEEIPGDEKEKESRACHCGSQDACSTRPPAPSTEAELPELDDKPERIVLMCPTCDEPFMPEFPRDCAMCGHRFPDGFEVELRPAPPEQIGSRVIAMIVGMAALLISLVCYFVWIVK
jgi:hypothetical protein